MHQRDIHLFNLYRSLDINQLRRKPLIFVRMNIFMFLTQFSYYVHDDHVCDHGYVGRALKLHRCQPQIALYTQELRQQLEKDVRAARELLIGCSGR